MTGTGNWPGLGPGPGPGTSPGPETFSGYRLQVICGQYCTKGMFREQLDSAQYTVVKRVQKPPDNVIGRGWCKNASHYTTLHYTKVPYLINVCALLLSPNLS